MSSIHEQNSSQSTAIFHRNPGKPPVATSGKGIYITLENGRTLVDAGGGPSVNCLGNGHPGPVQAIKDQLDKFSYVYNFQCTNEPAEELARIIIDSSGGAFELCGFLSGGSEAMEAAIKLARQYFQETGQLKRTNFIARSLSYHGNTLGTLSLGMHPARRAPYEPIIKQEGYHHVSPAYAARFQSPDETEEQYVERLRKELEDKFIELGPDTVIAFVAETVVGATTGCVPAPKGYFKAVHSVCKKYGALVIYDEIMCGMGRVGTTHAWEILGDGVAPDIQAVAKGLGGGYASIGAVLASKEVVSGIRDNSGHWQHGHTFQAHPLACAASLAVQKVIASEGLLQNVRTQGDYLVSLLRERLQSPNAPARPFIFDIRGGGLFWGIEFDFASPEAKRLDFRGGTFASLLYTQCFDNGVLIMAMSGGSNLEGTKGDHCIISPAYNVTRGEIENIVDLVVKSIEEVIAKYSS